MLEHLCCCIGLITFKTLIPLLYIFYGIKQTIFKSVVQRQNMDVKKWNKSIVRCTVKHKKKYCSEFGIWWKP